MGEIFEESINAEREATVKHLSISLAKKASELTHLKREWTALQHRLTERDSHIQSKARTFSTDQLLIA